MSDLLSINALRRHRACNGLDELRSDQARGCGMRVTDLLVGHCQHGHAVEVEVCDAHAAVASVLSVTCRVCSAAGRADVTFSFRFAGPLTEQVAA